jgi:hypothetical protein
LKSKKKPFPIFIEKGFRQRLGNNFLYVNSFTRIIATAAKIEIIILSPFKTTKAVLGEEYGF